MVEQKSKHLRGYIKKEKDSGQWVAVCLELSLAAQADSLDDVKVKLLAMIESYVSEALEDTEFTSQLLNRPAPLSQWATYYKCRIIEYLKRPKENSDDIDFDCFTRDVPLAA